MPAKQRIRLGVSCSIEGAIEQISVCPHGLTEGFVVNRAFVKLPPHHDHERELSTLRVGDRINVSGEVIAAEPNAVLHHVTITRAGKVVFNHDQIEKSDKPEREPKRRSVDIVGAVVAIGTRKHGEVDRLLLSGNVSVHLDDDFDRAINVGDTVRVKGEGTMFPRALFVRAHSISVD
jgi:hypothetical protein